MLFVSQRNHFFPKRQKKEEAILQKQLLKKSKPHPMTTNTLCALVARKICI